MILLSRLKIPDDYTLGGIGITQSMLSAFTRCRIEFLIKLNRYKRKDKSRKTGFGSMFHELLDKTYALYKKCNNLPDAEMISLWIETYFEENPDHVMNRNEEELDYQRLFAEILMKYYLRYYELDFTEGKILYLEQEFAIKFHNAICRGKVDGIVSDISGGLWLLEHKTRKRIYEMELKQMLNFDFQSLFYITMMEKAIRQGILGVKYNLVRNPGHSRKSGESWKGFEKRFSREVSKDLPHFFKRMPQYFASSDKTIFRRELMHRLDDVQFFLDNFNLYKNENSCLRQYACDHLTACSEGKLINYKQEETLFPELGGDSGCLRVA